MLVGVVVRHLAPLAVATPSDSPDDARHWESAGKLPAFAFAGADLEEPGMLERVVRQAVRATPQHASSARFHALLFTPPAFRSSMKWPRELVRLWTNGCLGRWLGA